MSDNMTSKTKKVIKTLLAFGFMGAAIAYLFLGDTAIRQMTHLRWAEEHIPVVKNALGSDPRFKDINVGRFTGSGGAILVAGQVRSGEDRESLEKIVKATHSPVPVIYDVEIRNSE